MEEARVKKKMIVVLPQILVPPPKHFRSLGSVFILLMLSTQKLTNEGGRFINAFWVLTVFVPSVIEADST